MKVDLAAGGIPEGGRYRSDGGSESTVRGCGRARLVDERVRHVATRPLSVFRAGPRGTRAGYRMHAISLPAGGRTPWS